MPILNVREMGSAGVITDIAPWDLPPSALTDGMNFRVQSGKIQTVGGLRDASGGPVGDELGHITQSTDLDKNSLWVLLGQSTVKTFDGQTTQSIDASLTFPSAQAMAEPHKWSSCQIGSIVVMNHPSWVPIYWEDRDAAVEQAQYLPWKYDAEANPVPWSTPNVSCKVIRAHKNFLWALGMSEDGDTFSDKLRWSQPAEPNGVPYTWETPAEDPSSIAGYVTIGNGGAVVGGQSLRDSFIVYSDEAINAFDFTGDALVWRRRAISASAGLVGKEAVVEVNGTHFFMSADDILAFDGNSVQSLMHNKLRTRLAQSINNEKRDRCWAAHNSVFNEIWFAVPEGTAEYPNVAYVFNYRDGTWALRDLEKQFRHGHFGNNPTLFDSRTWDGFETAVDAEWDQGKASWHLAGTSPFNGVMYGVEGQIVHNIDPQAADGTPLSFVKRTDMPIGGHEANTTISRVYPLVEGTGTIEMRFGSQQRAGGEVRWASDWIPFRPSVDRKIDIRTTGELHAYEVRSKGSNFFFLTGFDIEYSPAGYR